MAILGSGLLDSSSTENTLYQYWRIINTTPAGGSSSAKQWLLRELKFFDSNSQLLSIGGTPEGYNGVGDDPSVVFDGNLNTFLTVTNTSYPMLVGAGVGYKFSSPILPCTISISNVNNGFNIPPTDYSLQKSSDNINWITHQNFTINTDDSTFQSIEVDGAIIFDPNKYQWWRILNTSPATGGDAQWICRELRFLDSINTIISVGGVQVLYSWIGDSPAKAFDNDLSTFVTVTSPAHPNEVTGQGIGYRFQRDVLPNYVQISNLNNGLNIPPTNYCLQKSRDNVTWINHQDFTIGTYDYTFYSVAVLGSIASTPIVPLLLQAETPSNSSTITNSGDNRYSVTLNPSNVLQSTDKSYIGLGSLKFNGSSSLIDCISSIFNVDSADCTIELLFNSNTITDKVLFDMRPDGGNGNYPEVGFNGNTIAMYQNSTQQISGAVTISINSWYYVALRKISGITELWFQGNKIGQYNSGDWGSSGRILIGALAFRGAAPSTYFDGYIDQFTFTLGDAKDVSVIPSPTNIDPNFANTVLLMHMNGINNSNLFVDVKGNSFTGNAIISTDRYKFNGSSGYFDGSKSIVTPNNTTFNFNSANNFAFESWIYLLGSGSAFAICGKLPQIASQGYSFHIQSNGNLAFESDGGTPHIDSGLSVPINQWVYVGASKSGNNYTFAVNNAQSTINNATPWSYSNHDLYIGQNGRNDQYSSYFYGNIAELRITDTARTLAVPTQPFPNN